MGGKRYYWLKLKDDFFSSKRIKKLRAMAGGDTFLIIYLKMQLLAMKSDGVLTWTGLEEKFTDELALDLDEEPDNVAMTLVYLLKTGLAETSDNTTFFFPYAVENTGSEGASAQRWRDWKARQALDSNKELTDCKQIANGEIEKEIEIEIEKEKRDRKFVPPTQEEVEEYCNERNNNVDPQKFVNYYQSNGWKVGRNPMKDWRAAVRTWEKNNNDNKRDSGTTPKSTNKWNLKYAN